MAKNYWVNIIIKKPIFKFKRSFKNNYPLMSCAYKLTYVYSWTDVYYVNYLLTCTSHTFVGQFSKCAQVWYTRYVE